MANGNGDPASTPPYMPLATFRSAVQSLRDHGLPPKIDRTAWGSRSGSDQTQIVSAFKFLGLIDEKEQTLDRLRKLHAATANGDDEKRLLADILKDRYRKVFELDLTTATPKLVQDAIVASGATTSTTKRAIRFFLKAAQFAGIPISTRLSANLRDRSGDDATTTPESVNGSTPKKKRQRRVQPASPDPAAGGHAEAAIHTITLPQVGGELTLSGGFNAFRLIGVERDLVFKIIDLMNEFAATAAR